MTSRKILRLTGFSKVKAEKLPLFLFLFPGCASRLMSSKERKRKKCTLKKGENKCSILTLVPTLFQKERRDRKAGESFAALDGGFTFC